MQEDARHTTSGRIGGLLSTGRLAGRPLARHNDERYKHAAQKAGAASWLGVVAHPRFAAPMIAQLDSILSSPDVMAGLDARGVDADAAASVAWRDLNNLARGLTLLADGDAQALLKRVLPGHIHSSVAHLDLRLDHVGREVACPIDPLLAALRAAVADITELMHLPQESPSASSHGDLVFPSVQVVDALKKEDPTVEAVTIARSFLQPSSNLAQPVSLELFYVGRRDGTGAQHIRHMDRRLRSLIDQPSRRAEPPTPICHISVEVADLAGLELVHELSSADRSGLIKPYGSEISVNHGDGSHNTKLAVRLGPRPQGAVNVLEFAYFA